MKLKRYIKLYPLYVSRSIKAKLAYRLDAVVGILGFLLENALTFATLYLTISAIPALNGWDVNMMGFLYGFYLIPKAIDHIFSDYIWQLGNGGITRGELDRFLLRPVNPLFQLIAEIVQLEGLGELILGIIFLFVFTPQMVVAWTFDKVLALVICVFFAMWFFFAIKLITGSLSFWTKRSIQIMTMVYDFSNFAKYPIQIFNRAIQVFMIYVIPFSVVIYLPIEALLFGGDLWIQTLYVGIASIAMVFVSLFIWTQGLKRYESAGS